MTVSAFLHRQLVDLLEDHRVVVWYDAEGAFREWATQFAAPQCIAVDTSASILESRRRADRICMGLNDADDTEFPTQEPFSGSSPNRVGNFGPLFRFLAACT